MCAEESTQTHNTYVTLYSNQELVAEGLIESHWCTLRVQHQCKKKTACAIRQHISMHHQAEYNINMKL